MTDAHCHVADGESRCFLCSPFALPVPDDAVLFYGTHPWYLDGFDGERLRAQLAADPSAGVGEIGLDRLRDRNISPRMREVFEAQLKVAAEFGRPVVLHGAKCWGEVVKACCPYAGRIPAFLFHGFSRSEGLLPDIVAMNGFVSVGPAILNDHAVNYRELVKRIPMDRILVESDRLSADLETSPRISEIAARLAGVIGVRVEDFVERLEANADEFVSSLAHFTEGA